MGELRSTLSLDKKNVNKIPELPDSYTIVTPAYFKAPPDPLIADKHLPLPDPINLKAKFDWLHHVYLTESINDSIQVTWSAYNAEHIRDHQFDISITSLMPLLRDKAHDLVATVKHTMDKIF